MTETVRESGRSAFYISKDTFDAVGISVAFVAEIEAVAVAGVFQWCRAVDERIGVRKTLCVLRAHENRRAVLGTSSTSCFSRNSAKNACASTFVLVGSSFVCSSSVGFSVDGGGQPVLFVVEPNHGLVDRDVIRRLTVIGL